MVLRGELRSFPKTRAFDVHTYIVQGRLPARKVDRVLTLAATKFQHNRSGGGEHPLVPMAFDRMILESQGVVGLGLVQNRRCIRLEKAGESLVLREFSKLVVSHYLLVNMTPSPLIASESFKTLAFRRQRPCSGKRRSSL